MKHYRITKYNPKHRDEAGQYTKDEWTSYSAVGKYISEKEYLEIEKAYIETALSFIRENGIEGLTLKEFENQNNYSENNSSLAENQTLNISQIEKVIQNILREKYWAKLEAKEMYIHFGYDFYMYIGVSNESLKSIEFTKTKGLFVEEFHSPYLA